MRQSSLIAALALLVLLGAAAAWFFLRPADSAPVNAGVANADLDQITDSDPLDGVPRSNRPRRSNREPHNTQPETTEPELTPAPGEGEWLLQGSIDLAPELAALAPTGHEWSQEVYVYFLAEDKGPDDSVSLYFELGENRVFRDTFSEADFNLEAGASLPEGTWQVLYADEGTTSDSLFNLNGGVSLESLKGIVKPRITGRIINFGAVTIGVDEYFYYQVFLTGRLVHSSGRALAYSGSHTLEAILHEEDGSEWSLYGEFTTRGDGTFKATAWLDEPASMHKLPKYQWTIRGSNQWWDTERFAADKILPPPVWKGRQAHFGDITLAGALVEIAVTGALESTLGTDGYPAVDEWGEYDGECVEVSFEGSNEYYSARAFPLPHMTVMVLEEGRYMWSASGPYNAFYPQFSGVLLARHGQTYRIELDFTPFATIPLLVKAGEEMIATDSCNVYWSVMRGDKYIGGGNFYYTADSRVPVSAGCETTVYVSYRGYQDIHVAATPEMARLEITMQKDDRPTAKLVVVMPALPEGTTQEGLGVLLQMALPEQSVCAGREAWTEWPSEYTFTVYSFGRGSVALHGGLNRGYPGGILSGPVAFEIAQGETKRVELPPIPAPPWDKPVSKIVVEAWTSGCPMNLVASLRYKDIPGPFNDSLSNGGTLGVRGLPVALTDGREDYPVRFSPGDDGTGRLTIELPHTIEVRLTRGGSPVETFSVWASTTPNEAPDLSVQCEAYSIEGVAKLWIPRGLVNLDMRIDGSSVCSQQVEVTPGQVLRVEAGSSLLRLGLEVPENDYDPYNDNFDAPELWMMQYQDSEGVWSDYSSVSYTTSIMVEAGKYRMVPWNGGESVEFEMIDEDKTLTLPDIKPPTFGTVILKFDVAGLGDSWASPDFNYVFTDKLGEENYWVEEHWITSTLVPDGFKLTGLPTGVEIAIWGQVWISSNTDEYGMLLRPVALTVTSEQQLVEVLIKRAVALDEEWYNIDARWVSPVPNLYRPANESALPGRQEIAIYQDTEILFRDWVTVPETSEEPFKIPDGLRRELESRELISPVEDE